MYDSAFLLADSQAATGKGGKAKQGAPEPALISSQVQPCH